MGTGVIRAGNGTHTGMMLGYCPDCGLYHGSPDARELCAQLVRAADLAEELRIWRALKAVVALEPPIPGLSPAAHFPVTTLA